MLIDAVAADQLDRTAQAALIDRLSETSRLAHAEFVQSYDHLPEPVNPRNTHTRFYDTSFLSWPEDLYDSGYAEAIVVYLTDNPGRFVVHTETGIYAGKYFRLATLLVAPSKPLTKKGLPLKRPWPDLIIGWMHEADPDANDGGAQTALALATEEEGAIWCDSASDGTEATCEIHCPLPKIENPPDYVGRLCYSVGATDHGRITSTKTCQLYGCQGLMLRVQWPDGRWTWPCTKACGVRLDGHLQIDL